MSCNIKKDEIAAYVEAVVIEAMENLKTCASFHANTFSLPDLGNPMDSYQIVISAPSLEEPLKLALPKEPWTWRFRLNQENPPELLTSLPPVLKLKRGDLDDGEYPFSWTQIPNAKRYSVTGKARQRDYATRALNCSAPIPCPPRRRRCPLLRLLIGTKRQQTARCGLSGAICADLECAERI
nr:hypothetical protein [uncultured Duganella sp.]